MNMDLLWNKFVAEERGAIQQIIHFVEQLGFLEPLVEGGFEIDDAIYISTVDADMRMEDAFPPRHKEVFIDLE